MERMTYKIVRSSVDSLVVFLQESLIGKSSNTQVESGNRPSRQHGSPPTVGHTRALSHTAVGYLLHEAESP